MIPNEEREGRHYLAVKKIICIITRYYVLQKVIFIAAIVFILLE